MDAEALCRFGHLPERVGSRQPAGLDSRSVRVRSAGDLDADRRHSVDGAARRDRIDRSARSAGRDGARDRRDARSSRARASDGRAGASTSSGDTRGPRSATHGARSTAVPSSGFRFQVPGSGSKFRGQPHMNRAPHNRRSYVPTLQGATSVAPTRRTHAFAGCAHAVVRDRRPQPSGSREADRSRHDRRSTRRSLQTIASRAGTGVLADPAAALQMLRRVGAVDGSSPASRIRRGSRRQLPEHRDAVLTERGVIAAEPLRLCSAIGRCGSAIRSIGISIRCGRAARRASALDAG